MGKKEIIRMLKKVSEYLKGRDEIFYLKAGYVAMMLNLAILIYCWKKNINMLNREIFCTNPIYMLIAGFLPLILWVFSTKNKFFNYTYRKRAALGLAIANFMLVVGQLPYKLAWIIFVPKIMDIQTNELMTREMVIRLARRSVLFPTGITTGLMATILFKTVFSKTGLRKIDNFRINKIIDFRENKESAYDFKVVRDINTGMTIPVKESDRFTHTLVNGATGTGKTSSIFMNGINDDIDRKIKNNETKLREFAKMVLNDEATAYLPVGEFKDTDIVPNKGFEKKYKEIIKKYPDCGLTVLAPNSGLTDDTVKLLEMKGIKNYNVIDPMPDEDTGMPKKNLVGMNPFFVEQNLSEEEKIIQISDKAALFADVLVSINELKGKVDPYFSGINQAVTINVSIIVMAAIPLLKGRQANILDVQECIDDYDELKPLIKKLEEHYNIHIEKKNDGPIEELPVHTESDAKDYVDKSSFEMLKQKKKHAFFRTIKYVKTELLGEGREKMFDQSRGLRNLLATLTMNPRVEKILTMENCINFDKILHNGEFTVCNTAAELGDSVSTAFGLFFLLSMKQAVYRRRINDRKNHYWYIDEFALYLHPCVEGMFTLFRQYRVAMTVAIQTLEQMEKTSTTKYLKGVITNSSSTHIVFGRINLTEMELYEKLSGKELVNTRQESVTKNSILSDNPTMSSSERISENYDYVVKGIDMRNKDFHGLTMFTVNEGSVVDPMFGDAFFLDWKKVGHKPEKINWGLIAKPRKIEEIIKPEDRTTNEESKRAIAQAKKRQTYVFTSSEEIPETVQKTAQYGKEETKRKKRHNSNDYKKLMDALDNVDTSIK